MPSQQQQPDQFFDAAFPLSGLDVSNIWETQRPGTTAYALNVRACEPQTQRMRGGSRSGLSQFIPAPVIAGKGIQCLDFVVDPSANALLADLNDGTFEDPSTSNRSHRKPPGSHRFLRRGGHGRMGNRHTPHFGLTITANDQTKGYGGTFVFVGSEFTAVGLQGADTVASCSLNSPGALPSAPVGKYPIYVRDAQPGPATILADYKIAYVSGTMTVSGITYVQDTGLSGSTGSNPLAFARDVTIGNLIVVLATTINGSNNGVTVAITDSQGNSYSQAGSYSRVTGGGGTNGAVSIWYTTASASGPLTVTMTVAASGSGAWIGIAEFSGQHASPLDGTATSSGTATAGGPVTSGLIPVAANGDLVIAGFVTVDVVGGGVITFTNGTPFAWNALTGNGPAAHETADSADTIGATAALSTVSMSYASIGASFLAA